MSKPTLSQIVEINRIRDDFIAIWEGDKCHYVKNDDVIERFGDVEISDLAVHLSYGCGNKGERMFIPKIEVIL